MPYLDGGAGACTYYEVTGEGEPVVLLHGGLSGADAWQGQVSVLVDAGFRVWTPERRGHGHSPDTDAPFTYAAMTEETAAFLDAAVRARAHLVGWSDGAVVAARVAAARPELVDRLVLIGQYYDSSGQVQGGLVEALDTLREHPPPVLQAAYAAVSPDGPGHFPVVVRKTVDLWVREPELPPGTLARVVAPTLVLQGDRDEVRLEHSARVAATLPRGRLAVLPGTHLLPLESPGPVGALLVDFLRGGPHELDLPAAVEQDGSTAAAP